MKEFSKWNYLWAVIFLLLLTILAFVSFIGKSAGSFVYLLVPFVVASLTISASFYFVSKKLANFKRRAIVSSVIILFSIWLIVSVISFVWSVTACSTECGWVFVISLGAAIISLVVLVIIILLILYFSYVSKTYVHLIICTVLVILIFVLLFSSYLKTGCLRFDIGCISDKVILESDLSLCLSSSERTICMNHVRNKVSILNDKKYMDGTLTREDCDWQYNLQNYGEIRRSAADSTRNICYKKADGTWKPYGS